MHTNASPRVPRCRMNEMKPPGAIPRPKWHKEGLDKKKKKKKKKKEVRGQARPAGTGENETRAAGGNNAKR